MLPLSLQFVKLSLYTASTEILKTSPFKETSKLDISQCRQKDALLQPGLHEKLPPSFTLQKICIPWPISLTIETLMTVAICTAFILPHFIKNQIASKRHF